MNKNMIVYKENFFTKIKNVFLNIFRKDTSKDEIIEDYTNIINNQSNFKSSITIKQDKEELKILKLQQDYKAGNILEQDMTDEEHKKLIELYKKQNDDLKEKIEIKKNNLRKRLNDLKVS